MRWIVYALLTCCSIDTYAQEQVETLSFEQLQDHLTSEGDTVHVVNFWATWCKPCVVELPFFEKLTDMSHTPPIKVTLVSLDFKHQVASKLMPFIEEKKIQSKVLHLYERNPNDWIDQLNADWSGAIPATFFIHGEKERFHEGEFAGEQEILDIINSIYNSKS